MNSSSQFGCSGALSQVLIVAQYAFIEKDYEEDDNDEEKPKTRPDRKERTQSPQEEVKSELPVPVQQLLELIFNRKYFAEVMEDMNYDANKMPLGKLSKRTLQSGAS